MATYNGGSFLSTQIESVLAQRRVDIRLVIADDGSTDGTA
ncbi:MAG: glycosyltransferase, partial [Agrococcus casei]